MIRDQIKTVVEQTKDSAELLEALGGLTSPSEFDFPKEEFKDILLYAKELRDRYAALQIMYDLGVLDDISDTVIQRHFK